MLQEHKECFINTLEGKLFFLLEEALSHYELTNQEKYKKN
jgi:hypothetical protein